jgi:hypothetical protein
VLVDMAEARTLKRLIIDLRLAYLEGDLVADG